MSHFDKHMPQVQAEAERARQEAADRERRAADSQKKQAVIDSVTAEFLARMSHLGNPGLVGIGNCRTEDVGKPWAQYWDYWVVETNRGPRYLHEASKSWNAPNPDPRWACPISVGMADVDPDALARSLAVILATHGG